MPSAENAGSEPIVTAAATSANGGFAVSIYAIKVIESYAEKRER